MHAWYFRVIPKLEKISKICTERNWSIKNTVHMYLYTTKGEQEILLTRIFHAVKWLWKKSQVTKLKFELPWSPLLVTTMSPCDLFKDTFQYIWNMYFVVWHTDTFCGNILLWMLLLKRKNKGYIEPILYIKLHKNGVLI